MQKGIKVKTEDGRVGTLVQFCSEIFNLVEIEGSTVAIVGQSISKDETETPSNGEVVAVTTDSTATPPADKTETPSNGEVVSSTTDSTATPPADETETPSNAEVVSATTDATVVPPIDERQILPTEDTPKAEGNTSPLITGEGEE